MEFCAVLPLATLVAAIVVGGALHLALREWVRAEVYFLARTHLYGNRADCELRPRPLLTLLRRIELDCSGRGSVVADFATRGPFRSRVAVDLAAGKAIP